MKLRPKVLAGLFGLAGLSITIQYDMIYTIAGLLDTPQTGHLEKK